MASTVEIFRDRLLDRVPVYKAEGREINALPWPALADADAAWRLAQATSRWILDALAVAVERDDDLAAIALTARRLPPPATEITARAWLTLATDVASVARAWPELARLRPLTLEARGAFDAVAISEWGRAGEAAADALHAHAHGLPALLAETRRTVELLAP